MERVIREEFIPALLGGQLVSDEERLMLSLPARFGGLAVDNPVATWEHHHGGSVRLSQDLAQHLVQQKEHFVSNLTQQAAEKKAIRTAAEIKWKAIVNELQTSLPLDRYRALLAPCHC